MQVCKLITGRDGVQALLRAHHSKRTLLIQMGWRTPIKYRHAFGITRGAWGGRSVGKMSHYALGVADFPVHGADAMEDYEPPNPTDFKLEAKPRPITTEGDWG